MKAVRDKDVHNWKDSEIWFYPCWKKSSYDPIYKIPVKRALNENFYDLCVEAWNSPIPSSYDKRTDSSCAEAICDWTNTEMNAIEINFSIACNAHCKFCNLDHTFDKDLEDFYYKCLFDVSSSNKSLPLTLTTAGEPFFNKHKTLQFLESLHNRTIQIVTNLTALSEEDAYKIIEIKEKNNLKLEIHVSLNGIDEKTISAQEGISINWKQVCSILDIFNKANMIYKITNVITPEVIWTIPFIKDTLSKISEGLNKKLVLLTNLDIYSNDAKIVMESKEWKDFFKDKPANMNNAPKSLVLE